MSTCNHGTITGRIVSDLVVREPSDSLTVTSFRIKPADSMDTISAIPIIAYNGTGKSIQRYNKGDTITVSFHLMYNTWKDKNTNEPRAKLEVIANDALRLKLGKISASIKAEETRALSNNEALETQAIEKIASPSKELVRHAVNS